nr:hypothetical protein [Ectothiorhodospira mobilis]
MHRETDSVKRYGIRMTLPEGDTFRAPHLLGPHWEEIQWFDSARARDEALERMRNPPAYYRRGDAATLVYEKVER